MLVLRVPQAREADRLVNVVPFAVAAGAGLATPDPVGPGAGAHECPLVDGEAVWLLLGQIVIVVRVLFQNRRHGGPLAFFVPGEDGAGEECAADRSSLIALNVKCL